MKATPKNIPPRERLIFALDVSTIEEARQLIEALGESVNFYKLGLGESTLLFIVRVRYYQNQDGKWVSHFQLNEEPLVMRGADGKWQPLTIIQGVPSLIMQTGTALPNAEGYAASLELGFTTGAMPIDAWLVQ